MKSIIFDLDGTLLDSMGMWHALDRRFLLERGIEPPADISDIVKSMTVEQAAAYFIERFSLEMTHAQVIARVGELAEEAYRLYLPLKDGARDFLQALTDRGIPCALASVTFRALLDAALERLQVGQFFSAVLTPSDGMAGKHAPDLYLEAARRLGTSPAETLVIEDALYAAQTAKRAGFPVIGMRDADAAHEWTALESVCDRVIDGWRDLLSSAFFQTFTD